MLTLYHLDEARAHARARHLREKAVCQITRQTQGSAELLVFDHVPDNGSGVQVVAGGVDPGETPDEAALREAQEETGRTGFRLEGYLGSTEWIDDLHAKRELRHFYHLTAPPGLPDTWDHAADGHLFRFRWEGLSNARIDWHMDAFLPTPTPEETSA
ncbi:8-oxo-dGTP pyrophosphatase MutT (NUDIX family) [Deinococcus sp. HSC-46F16]|uniref:NUDIX hydrolase n=1 Tax=Deinococcus sp. HSC-46F16 TaxID=2910968 RepID=UPI00209E4A58|nr:NUDIX domain-containing protein [Deinococcus sp. HSC-46F16]MCP2013959.1 8-oxo-dGTP pyrophosphatase MutT (NUDIX family) [Deinococcus sp. HSC-46F16]